MGSYLLEKDHWKGVTQSQSTTKEAKCINSFLIGRDAQKDNVETLLHRVSERILPYACKWLIKKKRC